MSRHRFHGDAERFDVVARFVDDHYGRAARYIADVAGGQGMLTRILRKRFNYEAEVVDPRGWVLHGVPARQEEFTAEMADYYDLVIGLHPDEALSSVVEAAKIRPALIVPCCNFFDRSRKLGKDELLQSMEEYLVGAGVNVDRRELAFAGPFNVALACEPR